MLYVAYSKLRRGKLFSRKKPHSTSEKRHKISKFANDQNKMVRNSPAFDRYDFVASKSDVSKILHFILFAADTNIFFSHKKSWKDLE